MSNRIKLIFSLLSKLILKWSNLLLNKDPRPLPDLSEYKKSKPFLSLNALLIILIFFNWEKSDFSFS